MYTIHNATKVRIVLCQLENRFSRSHPSTPTVDAGGGMSALWPVSTAVVMVYLSLSAIFALNQFMNIDVVRLVVR
jgi:hypothetical protein